MTTQQTDGWTVPEFHMGDRMAKALDYAGISRGEMAEYMDVTTETLRRWTTMSSPIKKSTLRLWSMRTGVPIEWLETGQAPKSSTSGPDQQRSGYGPPQVSAPQEAEVVEIETFRRRHAERLVRVS